MHTLVLSIRIHEGLGKQGGFGHICVFFNIERDGIIVEFVSFSPSVKILFSLDTIRLFILFTRGVSAPPSTSPSQDPSGTLPQISPGYPYDQNFRLVFSITQMRRNPLFFLTPFIETAHHLILKSFWLFCTRSKDRRPAGL